MNPRRLYRSRRDHVLAGVAAGMADYFELDPTLVRIAWIVSTFAGGFTIVLYVILAFVIPLEPYGAPYSGPTGGTTTGATILDADGNPVAGGSGEAGSTGEPGSVSGSTTGWSAAPSYRHERRGGRAGLVIGVLLVGFGSLALADSLLPGWAFRGSIGPIMLVALGALLLVGSIRRSSEQR